MYRKLKECETCSDWDNGMKNRLRCMVGCAARQRHQAEIALEYNASCYAQSPTDMGYKVVGMDEGDNWMRR